MQQTMEAADTLCWSLRFQGGQDGEQTDGVLWCTCTMNVFGPDGRVADYEGCRPGRRCYGGR